MKGERRIEVVPGGSRRAGLLARVNDLQLRSWKEENHGSGTRKDSAEGRETDGDGGEGAKGELVELKAHFRSLLLVTITLPILPSLTIQSPSHTLQDPSLQHFSNPIS